VDDAGLVGDGQRIEHLAHQIGRLGRRQSPLAGDQFGQIGAIDELEHQVRIAALLAQIENRHEIRVPQGADGTCLLKQRGIAVNVRTREVQRLDRHFALQLGVPRKIDDALGTAPKFTSNFEAADTLGFHRAILSGRRHSPR